MTILNLLQPSFQILLILSSLSFFWFGVYLGSDAFDHLTGLNQILQAKHSRINPYEGDIRLDILRKLDVKIAENGPSIEDSELFPQDYRNSSPKNKNVQDPITLFVAPDIANVSKKNPKINGIIEYGYR